MKTLSCIVLVTALLSTFVGCRKAVLPDFVNQDEKSVMENNPCFPRYGKGGIGQIYDNDYVATKSKRNEIGWGEGENSKEWVGKKASKPEVAVFFGDKVWLPQSLPHDFDKNKSVVVSFEEKYIRFYDYVHREGCNYERDPEY